MPQVVASFQEQKLQAVSVLKGDLGGRESPKEVISVCEGLKSASVGCEAPVWEPSEALKKLTGEWNRRRHMG